MIRSEPPSAPSPGRRGAAILIAIAGFAAAAVFAWTTFSQRVREGGPPTPAARPGSPTGVDLSSLPEGWTELPAPPEIRGGAAQAWTGSELLVWGGNTGLDESTVVASVWGKETRSVF